MPTPTAALTLSNPAGGLNVGSGSVFNFVANASGSNCTSLVVNGNLNLNGTGNAVNLYQYGTSTWAVNGTFPIIQYFGTLTGTPSSTLIGNSRPGEDLHLQRDGCEQRLDRPDDRRRDEPCRLDGQQQHVLERRG